MWESVAVSFWDGVGWQAEAGICLGRSRRG